MTKIKIGIDLGTTYSAVSYYDTMNHRVETIDLVKLCDGGGKLLRSAVFYPGQGQDPVLGDTAINASRRFPDRVITLIKRQMGTSYKTSPIDGVEHTPQQVSAELLKGLWADAVLHLGEPPAGVVITVPAYFEDAERNATLEAGKLAGLPVDGLLPEPHAAALAYAIDKTADIQGRDVLVFDLGGGTFDVTVIRAKLKPGATQDQALDLDIDTLAKDGDKELGGADWDAALAQLVAEKVLATHQYDPRNDPVDSFMLNENCEKAKRRLSQRESVEIIADSKNHEVTVTRAEFEDATQHLLFRTQQKLESVVADAVAKHSVDKNNLIILLAGGASKMPIITGIPATGTTPAKPGMIEQTTGIKPIIHKNPEYLVTIGSALWAHLRGGTESVFIPDPQDPTKKKEVVITDSSIDIAGYPVGVKVQRVIGGVPQLVNSVILDGTEPFGTGHKTKFYGTVIDSQTEVLIEVFKGGSEDLAQCTKLAEYLLDIPPGPRGMEVEVKLGFSTNGILEGQAVIPSTGKSVSITISRPGSF